MKITKLIIVAGLIFIGAVIFQRQIGWNTLFSLGYLTFEGKTPRVREKEISPEKLTLSREKMEKAFNSLKVQLIKDSPSMPDFTLQNLEGKKISTENLRGKFLWINFWATWCPPCRAEMPSMQKVWEEFGGENFIILAVDLRENREKVRSFIKNNGYTFPILLDTSGDVGKKYGVRSIPTNFFVDPDGKVVGGAIGSREWDNKEFYEFLEALT